MSNSLTNQFSAMQLQAPLNTLPTGQLPEATASSTKLPDQGTIFKTLRELSEELSSYEPKKVALQLINDRHQLINDRDLNSAKKSPVTILVKQLVELRLQCKNTELTATKEFAKLSQQLAVISLEQRKLYTEKANAELQYLLMTTSNKTFGEAAIGMKNEEIE